MYVDVLLPQGAPILIHTHIPHTKCFKVQAALARVVGIRNPLYFRWCIALYIYPKLPKSWKIEVFQQRLKLGMKDLKRVTVFESKSVLDA